VSRSIVVQVGSNPRQGDGDESLRRDRQRQVFGMDQTAFAPEIAARLVVKERVAELTHRIARPSR